MKNKNKFSLVHATDIHLNFCNEARIKMFCDEVLDVEADAIVITGDIAEATTVIDYLGFLSVNLEKSLPIFFVLGNHDYYGGSILEVRNNMKKFFTYTEDMKKNRAPRLAWLGSSGVIPLTGDTAIVGHDGWYDGQYANWFTSNVWLNDYSSILELNNASYIKQLLFEKINELSRESAEYVRKNVTKAFDSGYRHVFVATHVSPFRETSTFKGKMSDENWMPHFSSKAMGDVLLNLASSNPEKVITVLSGHSHGGADVSVASNLRVIAGAAKYREPKIGQIFDI